MEGEENLDEDGEGDEITNDDQQEDQEDLEGEEQEEAETEEQMDYYMRQHPDLLLALDIAAYRRQQMQQRLQSHHSPSNANR